MQPTKPAGWAAGSMSVLCTSETSASVGSVSGEREVSSPINPVDG